MPIVGTRPVARIVARGSFGCPRCGESRPFVTQKVRRYLAVLDTPLVPMATLGSFIECLQCRGTFRSEVLDFDRERAQEHFLSEFQNIVRRLMAMMMLSDGRVTPEERQMARDLYLRLTGLPLSDREVETELSAAEREGRSVFEYLGETGGLLNENGRELVLKAAFLISSADGVFHEKELEFLRAVGRALHMSPAQMRHAIDRIMEEGS